MSTVKRIFDLHQHQLENYPKEDALASKVDGKWVKHSTQEMIDNAYALAKGFLKLGLNRGDKIAMVSNNRSEWVIADLAMLKTGIINVPIYPTITEEDYAYILNDAGVKMVLVSDEDLYKKISSIKSKVSSLEHIYSFDKLRNCEHWTTLHVDSDDNSEVDAISEKIDENELATLIYTSGTTGYPKGVMISHKNLVTNVKASMERLPCDQNSKSLSFLPLCHVYERMITYLYVYRGVSIYYAESMETIGDNLKEVSPQVFTAVPRLLEKIYDKIVAKGSELTGIKKALFFWALNLGLEYEIKGKSAWYNFQLKLANKIIFSKWREALGGKTLAVASGSAALQPRLARVFLAAQIPIREGYGMTETAVVISVNVAENDGLKIGSVGRPLSNVEVKIADDGEILVKGPNVMLGYYNNEEASKEIFTQDGWLKTGDIGELDEEGFLKITDRKKEIFKTSGGKYVAPQVMENVFKESLFIEQIMVIGENKKHPAALVQLDFEFIQNWAKRNKIQFDNIGDLIANEKVVSRIHKEIEKYNERFAQYEKVKKFRLVPSAWSIDGGEITPTLKLRRKIILEKYKEMVEDIYGDE